MRCLLHWLVEQRSGVAFGVAVFLFAATLVLRNGYDLWWPAGIVLATICGLVALFSGSQED
jgi:hypothetical protein